MPRPKITEDKHINCLICQKQMTILVYRDLNHPDHGQPIVAHKKKITCSRECHTEWQRTIDWEARVGKDFADSKRKIQSDLFARNNPSKDPNIAKKISKGLKQYIEFNPDSRVGSNNPFYGKTHTQEQKQLWHATKVGKWSYNDAQQLKQTTNTPKGENHPNWLGGISNGEYGLEFNASLKSEVKNEHNWQCQLCEASTDILDIHHIDYNKKNNSKDNLLPLCKVCHGKTNYNRDYYEKLLTEKKQKYILKCK